MKSAESGEGGLPVAGDVWYSKQGTMAAPGGQTPQVRGAAGHPPSQLKATSPNSHNMLTLLTSEH